MIEIARITPDDPRYEGEKRLREQVLLRAVGYDFASYVRDYPAEDRVEHFVAVERQTGKTPSGWDAASDPCGEPPVGSGWSVVGCGLLLPDAPEAGIGKVSQVAVDPQRRGEGIGLRVMTAIEARAFGELGHRELFCHAQSTAVEFYKKLGWGVASDEFTEAGIPHYKMAIRSGDRGEA